MNDTPVILAVDDQPKNIELIEALLVPHGYEIIAAASGAEALDKLAVNQIDLILLDVMMPGMDGFEVCRRIRQNPGTTHLPVLMLTALHDRSDRLAGIEAGANDFLTKPFDPTDARLRVKNAVYAKKLYDKVQGDFQRLQDLERLRDNLTHMIVHDLRSPLQGISASYEIALGHPESLSPTQLKFLTMGQNACAGLIEMVSTLLDVSRMEAGQMPVNAAPCDILEIAQVTAVSLLTLAEEKNLSLRVSGAPATVKADRELIRRVLVNLMANAITFSPDNRSVTITVSPENGGARVAVADSGYGIPEKYHRKIFEKFGQVESRKQGQKYSTGLGLTFCKLAIEAHGGAIGLESAESKGSTFWFTLPEHPPAGPVATRAA